MVPASFVTLRATRRLLGPCGIELLVAAAELATVGPAKAALPLMAVKNSNGLSYLEETQLRQFDLKVHIDIYNRDFASSWTQI